MSERPDSDSSGDISDDKEPQDILVRRLVAANRKLESIIRAKQAVKDSKKVVGKEDRHFNMLILRKEEAEVRTLIAKLELRLASIESSDQTVSASEMGRMARLASRIFGNNWYT